VVEAGAARRKEMQKVVVKAARGVALFYTSCQVPGRSVAMGDAKPGAGRACLHGATHMYSDSHYNGYYNCSRAQVQADYIRLARRVFTRRLGHACDARTLSPHPYSVHIAQKLGAVWLSDSSWLKGLPSALQEGVQRICWTGRLTS
jgi:hypothetical protein